MNKTMNYDKDVGLQFLKDMGLLPSSMVCSVCVCHMSSCVGTSVKDGFRWRSGRKTSASRYNVFRSYQARLMATRTTL